MHMAAAFAVETASERSRPHWKIRRALMPHALLHSAAAHARATERVRRCMRCDAETRRGMATLIHARHAAMVSCGNMKHVRSSATSNVSNMH